MKMENENKPELKRILNKYYENLENLEKILPKKEYRKSFAILTVNLLTEIYNSRKIKYNRMDLVKKTNLLLNQNGMKEYSYFFYRQFC